MDIDLAMERFARAEREQEARRKLEISERDYWKMRTSEVGRLVGEDWDDMSTFVQRARGAEGPQEGGLRVAARRGRR